MSLLEKLNKPFIKGGITALILGFSALVQTDNVFPAGNIYGVTYDKEKDMIFVKGRNMEDDWTVENFYFRTQGMERQVFHLSDAGNIDMQVSIPDKNGERANYYTVILWDRLVYGIDCRRGADKQQCSECDENGYHLEGEKGRGSIAIPNQNQY